MRPGDTGATHHHNVHAAARSEGRAAPRTLQVHRRPVHFVERSGSTSAPVRLLAAGSVIGVITGVIVVVVGLAVAFLGWTTIEDSTAPEDGVITTAVIVDWVEDTAVIDGIARPTFSPVYEYRDRSGQAHRVIDRINPGSRPPTVGAEVEVSYLEGEPESVRRTGLVADWMIWLFRGGVLAGAVGALLVVASLATALLTGSGLRLRGTARPTRR